MEDGNKLYNYCYDAAIRCGKSNIDKRLRDGQKIKVAFLPISAAEWPAERIYNMLRDDDRFLPVIVPVPIIGRTKEERGKTYSQTYKYFEENGYNVEHVYDPDTEEITGWEDIGGVPDVVIHVTPWYLDMVKNYQIINLPFSVLNVYISYGLTVGNSQTGRFDELCMYNKEFMNLCWRVYTETKTDYEEFIRYEALGGRMSVIVDILRWITSMMNTVIQKKIYEICGEYQKTEMRMGIRRLLLHHIFQLGILMYCRFLHLTRTCIFTYILLRSIRTVFHLFLSHIRISGMDWLSMDI